MSAAFSSGRRLAAEALGTGLLVAAVVGSGIMAESLAGGNVAIALHGNTLPTGAILVVLILALGPISGVHFNPAVSLVMGITGALPWRQVGPYMAAHTFARHRAAPRRPVRRGAGRGGARRHGGVAMAPAGGALDRPPCEDRRGRIRIDLTALQLIPACSGGSPPGLRSRTGGPSTRPMRPEGSANAPIRASARPARAC